MADVQLEHGFVRVANSLDGAINLADFTGTQTKIVRCLIRLTFGWGQDSVRLSHGEIAERCGQREAGGFRRALNELLANGVVVEVDRPTGRSPGAYRIHKDFEAWGRFSVAAARVAALFSVRPEPARRVPPQGHSTIDRVTLQGQSTDIPGDGRVTPQGQSTLKLDPPAEICPPSGGTLGDPLGAPKSPVVVENNQLRPPERKERQLKANTTATAAAAVPTDFDGRDTAPVAPEVEFAIATATAVNRAITDRWGSQSNPIHFGTGVQLASDLIASGVSLDTARTAIARVCAKKKGQPPTTLEYFRNPIGDEHRAVEQRALDASAPPPDPARVSTPTRIANVLEKATAEKSRVTQELIWDKERRVAADAWIRDHPTEHTLILQRATDDMADFLDTKWGQASRDGAVIVECAARAKFPDFDTWLRSRHEMMPKTASS